MSKFEVINDVESGYLALDDTHILGPKPCGGEKVIDPWETDTKYKAVNTQSRWYKLFGTPKRAVQTLRTLIEEGPFLVEESRDSLKSASVCNLLDELCGGCGKCPSCVNVYETEYSIKFECNGGDYDALLGWLRGDAE